MFRVELFGNSTQQVQPVDISGNMVGFIAKFFMLFIYTLHKKSI